MDPKSFKPEAVYFDTNVLVSAGWPRMSVQLSGRYQESQDLFEKLYETPMPPTMRHENRGVIRDEKGEISHVTGVLNLFETSFGFVRCCSIRTGANSSPWATTTR